jgi:penicillin-binding protein 1A
MRRRSRRGPSRAVFLVLGAVVVSVVLAICAGLGYIVSVAATAPEISELKPVDQGATSAVYAADGTRLGFIQGNVLRTPVPADKIPDTMRQATVAIEDRRFYKHGGVDFEGVIRAAIKNIASGKTVEGGSTLTMQLIRNLYTESRARSGLAGYKRKVREAKLASELEDKHPGPAGKAWILNQYLNNAPYGTVGGQQAVGVEAASRIYFDKPARKLTLAEAALLAGLPQAPSDYNPFLDPKAAITRRNEVLRQMAKEGYITQSAADAAQREKLTVKKSRYYAKRRESYFFDYVKQQLIDEFGAARVRQGGLKVYTTVDLKLQQEARKAIASRLATPRDPAAALVSIDPKTGYIKAMASSTEYSASKFNLAAQGRRQPGSAFKVMVLMTALRQNIDINKTTYESKPLKFVDKRYGPIDVNTDDHVYRGRTTVFNALVASDNTVFQQLDLDLGPEAVRDTAYDMGITSHLDAYPAEGLGGLTHGVSPLEMTRAYITVSDGGWRVKPIAITRVEFPNGKVDKSLGKPHRIKVFSDGQTYEAVKAMEANAQRGTGTAAQIGCPVAGKTGTTNDFVDAWFDGFTTSLNTTVWVGYPDASRSMSAVPGYGPMFGGKAPALIWHDFMTEAMKTRKCDPFPEPKEKFVPAPFFGEYATTGAPGGGSDPKAVSLEPQPGKDKKDKKDKKNGKGDKGGQNAYPPDQYESPPQTTTPPPGTQQAPPVGGQAPDVGGQNGQG